MKKSAFLVMLLTTVLLFSCTKTAQLSPLPGDAVILAFGDSLTYGTGAGENESYPAFLEKTVGRRVINAGVPGEVSAAGLQRLSELLEQEKPALLILCHGGNDLLRKLDQKALADNLRAMIRLARNKGVPVVMLAVPSPGLSLSPPPVYEEVASELAVPLDLKSLSKILGKSSLKSDYIHPNAAGYKELAIALEKLLRRSGALER